MDNKIAKNRLRTLCTIDTSDIELNDFRNQKIRNSTKKNQRGLGDPFDRSHSRAKSRITPSSNPPILFKPMDHQKSRSFSKKMNKTMNRSRAMTEYTTSGDHTLKTLSYKGGLKQGHTSHRSMSYIRKKVIFHYDEQYRIDAYEFLRTMPSIHQKQKINLVRREGALYIVKKTKDSEVKKMYALEDAMKSKMTQMKGRNLMKVHRSYNEKPWSYLVYEYAGERLCWDNSIHKQVIQKCLKDQGAVLVYFIREMAKAICELSAKGYVHGRVCLQNTYMKISETSNSVKVEGNVKLGNFGECFLINEKTKFLRLPDSINTPPEIINYKIFEKKGNFDRKLIEFISIQDQPWYIDVWALGILALEFIAGEPINLEKVVNSPNKMEVDSLNSSFSRANDKKDIWLVDDDITLQDILLAQKNLLFQIQQQLQAISFHPCLQSLLIRMLGVSPLDRPSPKEIIKQLANIHS